MANFADSVGSVLALSAVFIQFTQLDPRLTAGCLVVAGYHQISKQILDDSWWFAQSIYEQNVPVVWTGIPGSKPFVDTIGAIRLLTALSEHRVYENSVTYAARELVKLFWLVVHEPASFMPRH